MLLGADLVTKEHRVALGTMSLALLAAGVFCACVNRYGRVGSKVQGQPEDYASVCLSLM